MPLMGSGIPITLLALPARVGLRGILLRSASRRATQGRASLRSQPAQGEVFGAGAAPGVAAGIVPGVVPGATPSVARSVLPGALPGVVPGVTPGVAREARLTPPRPETCVSGPRARFPRRAFISHSAARTSSVGPPWLSPVSHACRRWALPKPPRPATPCRPPFSRVATDRTICPRPNGARAQGRHLGQPEGTRVRQV